LDLIVSLLQFNPAKRLTADQALAHPYFAPIRNVAGEISVHRRHALTAEMQQNASTSAEMRKLYQDEVIKLYIRMSMSTYVTIVLLLGPLCGSRLLTCVSLIWLWVMWWNISVADCPIVDAGDLQLSQGRRRYCWPTSGSCPTVGCHSSLVQRRFLLQ